MPLDPAVQHAMLKAIPELRGFAMALCHSPDQADDLVQEALVRGIARIDSFTPGSNMTAWLFTILRNHFYNEFRRRRREVQDSDGIFVGTMTSQPEQDSHLQFTDFRAALAKLPDEQREALSLVGGAGLSYKEAAEICRSAVGTVKSRANRGRARLAQMLSIETSDDLGPDRAMQAALSNGHVRWAA